MSEFEILHYVTPAGRDPFGDWLNAMRDRRAAATILLRISRLQRGLFGDCKPVGGGVSELRVDIGPGYRVYFVRAGENIILLLCGGDKRRQHDDITQAKRYWSAYSRATGPHHGAR
jgi:putative addiction module killer protein